MIVLGDWAYPLYGLVVVWIISLNDRDQHFKNIV